MKRKGSESAVAAGDSGSADYTLHIKTSPFEIAPNRIISATTYNGQFPGPLLRFKEGKQVTVDVYNDTDVAEQLHWHGQILPVDVGGTAEEGTPFIPAQGKRTIVSITHTIELERIPKLVLVALARVSLLPILAGPST